MKWLLIVAWLVSSCADVAARSAPSSAPGAPRAPAPPGTVGLVTSAPAHAGASDSCLTIRDEELGCTARASDSCSPLFPVIRACSTAALRQEEIRYGVRPKGEIDVRYQVDASGAAHVIVEAVGDGLAPVEACVRSAFNRFRPCSPLGPGEELHLPIRVSP